MTVHTRSQILERLRKKIDQGIPIIGGGGRLPPEQHCDVSACRDRDLRLIKEGLPPRADIWGNLATHSAIQFFRKELSQQMQPGQRSRINPTF